MLAERFRRVHASWMQSALDSVDSLAYDHQPDMCWRCDAKPGAAPLGLCPACRTDLKHE